MPHFTPSPDNHVRLNVYISKRYMSCIQTIAKSSNRSLSNTSILLMNTALKYNYTPDFRYIPCVPSRTYTSDKLSRQSLHKHEPAAPLHINISHAFNDKLISFAKATSFTEKLPQVCRMLIETALEYDYNNDLKFSPPAHIFNDTQNNNNIPNINSSSQTSSNSSIIRLDFI